MEYFDGFDDLEDLKEVKESDFVREFVDFYDNRKDAKSENEEDKIDNNDIALVRRNGNVNMRKDSDFIDPNSDDHEDFKKQCYNNKNFSGAQKKSSISSDPFDNLFSNCTIECDGKGNCFIWSALNILGKQINYKEMLNLRRELQETFNNLLSNFEYELQYGSYVAKDYNGLETPGEWVEIVPGVVSLASYMKKPLVVFSKSEGENTFEFFVANEKGEPQSNCSLKEIKDQIMSDNMEVIVLNKNHYQPLNHKYRREFLNGFYSFYIDSTHTYIEESIKSTSENKKEESLMNSIPILLPDNEKAALLYERIFTLESDDKSKEKNLLDIEKDLYEEAKKFNIDEDYLNIKDCSEVFDHADKNNDLSSVLYFDIIRDNRISNYEDKKNKEEKNRIPKDFMCKKKNEIDQMLFNQDEL